MRCTSDRPLFRTLGPRAASQCARAIFPLACAALFSCSGSTDPQPSIGDPVAPSGSNAAGTGPLGSSPAGAQSGVPGAVAGSPSASPGAAGSGTPGAAPGGTAVPPGSEPGATEGEPAAGEEVGAETEPAVPLSEGGVRLRLLTQAEYAASIEALLGPVTAELETAPDTSVAGFVSVGAALTSVTDSGVTAYEASSREATSEVFSDTQRWQELVGCQPADDLTDACVTAYIEDFGRKAFRRDLTDEEVQQWLDVAQGAAAIEGSAAQGLSTATVGMLQSPNFLYRVEINSLEAATSRLKYDGLSMATRLSYTVTGGPPSMELLDAAAAGQLDTAEGVAAAAASLVADPRVADRMTAFFSEYAQLEQVTHIAKSETLFPEFTPELQSSMLEGAELFLRNVVLAPNADVRAFYNGVQTYADANLASLYGVDEPASGFEQVTLPAENGRVGILGQAAFLAGQSQADRTSPTRRGLFLLQSLFCTTAPAPPGGVDTTLAPPDATKTTRENLEAHRVDPQCAGCHALFDPLGVALENFDPIGRYRDNENGLPIDASGEWAGTPFNNAAELGAILAQDPNVEACLLRNFYRNANGRAEDDKDQTQITAMADSLEANGYVWRDFLADFVASDAFRSAPALPVMTESP